MISKPLRWKYLAINGWLIFCGAVIGWSARSFPWGVLAVALFTTVVAAVVHKRYQGRKSQ